MFQSTESGTTPSPAHESTAVARSLSLPPQNQEVLRMFLLGNHDAIRRMIGRLAANGIADATRWTPPQPTGRDDEYITVHTKRMAAER